MEPGKDESFGSKVEVVGLCKKVAGSEIAQSCPTLFDPMDCSLSASPSMGFSRQECWSGLPFPSPGDLPDPGIEPGSPALLADAFPSEPPGKLCLVANSFLNFGVPFFKMGIKEYLLPG